IVEIARLTIDPAQAEAFHAAVAQCAPLFQRAVGCTAMSLEREVEDKSRYCLRVEWETLENHLDDFRNSTDFQTWRSLAGRFFKELPEVAHTQLVAKFF
ncbi:MAG: Antibiotic biosynthesis monooxygenase, partial [Alphaproteobacteria bacterium]|nr:Antibiotic biosynthesis monooxygenase [Alphaproteobacteria bacterium]